MTKPTLILATLVLGLLPNEAEARRALLPVSKRVEKAATIVVGKVEKTAPAPTIKGTAYQPDELRTATLKVSRVLKGACSERIVVLYSTREQRPSLARFKVGEQAVVFLRSGRLAKKYARMIVDYPDGKARIGELGQVRKHLTAWFAWRLRGKHLGYFRMRAEMVLGLAAPWRTSVRFAVTYEGQKMALDMEVHGKDDAYRTPVRIVSKGTGGEFASFDAKIAWAADGKGTATLTKPDGTTRTKTLPWPLVEGFTLFQLVQRRPFDTKQVLKFNTLEIPFSLKKDHQLKYLGTEELPIRGKAQSLHKFEMSGSGINPLHLWVDAKRRLVRVLMDRRKEFLRSGEKEARKDVD